MAYASPIERQAFISGLLALAGFLENNPEVPAPTFTDVLIFPPYSADEDKRREIDAIASRVGTETQTYGGHYVASRRFGPVEYRAVAIPTSEIGEW